MSSHKSDHHGAGTSFLQKASAVGPVSANLEKQPSHDTCQEVASESLQQSVLQPVQIPSLFVLLPFLLQPLCFLGVHRKLPSAWLENIGMADWRILGHPAVGPSNVVESYATSKFNMSETPRDCSERAASRQCFCKHQNAKRLRLLS